MNSKNNRQKSSIDSLDDLWKIERQLDAINQHTRIALAQVRQAIRKRETAQGIKGNIEPLYTLPKKVLNPCSSQENGLRGVLKNEG